MVSHRRSVETCLVVGVALSLGRLGTAYAQVEAPGDEQVRQRLDRVQAILDERAGRAQLWQYGWMGLGYAVTAGFATGSTLTSSKTDRLDFAFAAGGAFIDTTVHTLDSIRAHAAARLREQPATSPEEARIKLKFAESELAAVAEAESARQSLLKGHLLPNGVPVVTGLILWLGFGHLKGAAINTGCSSRYQRSARPNPARLHHCRLEAIPEQLGRPTLVEGGPSASLLVVPSGRSLRFLRVRFLLTARRAEDCADRSL